MNEVFYQDPHCRLIQADNIPAMREMESDKIDLTITSPPYDEIRDYTNDARWGWERFRETAREIFRITKPGGVLVWVVQDETKDGSESGTSFKQALYLKEECGFNLHDSMIWQKTNFPFPSDTHRRYQHCFEFMFVLAKGRPNKALLIKDRPNQPGAARDTIGRRQKDGSVKQIDMSWKTKPENSLRLNIWKTPGEMSQDRRGHPAPFPESIVADHIQTWTEEGDLVFDPFLGGGTSAMVARKMNRQFIGIEISSEYCEMAGKRIRNQMPLLTGVPA